MLAKLSCMLQAASNLHQGMDCRSHRGCASASFRADVLRTLVISSWISSETQTHRFETHKEFHLKSFTLFSLTPKWSGEGKMQPLKHLRESHRSFEPEKMSKDFERHTFHVDAEAEQWNLNPGSGTDPTMASFSVRHCITAWQMQFSLVVNGCT